MQMLLDKRPFSPNRETLKNRFPIRTVFAAKMLSGLLLLPLPAVVHAQFAFMTNNGALTITKYTGSGGAVTIPGTTNGMPVTSIGYKAFYQSYSVTSVIIPGTVTNMADSAFYYCWNLTSVTIPNSVTSIGTNVFANCYDLANVAISTNLTTIRSSAFYYCYSLTSFLVPDSVTRIESEAFANCYGMTNFVIGSNVTTIGSSAFYYCGGLTNVTIPAGVTNIGEKVFRQCGRLLSISVDAANPAYSSLDGVLFDKNQTALIQYPAGKVGVLYDVPNSVTNIEGYAFAYCTKLKSATLGTNVTAIGDGAFYTCTGLTNITIPNSVTSIGNGVFSFCSRLLAITVDALNSFYSSTDGVLFDKDQTLLIQYPGGKAGGYTVPDGVTSIGDLAFFSCGKLTSVTIPSSVSDIGHVAFSGCTSLTAITVDALNSYYISVAGVLFNNSQTTLIQYPVGNPGTSYTIPNTVTNVEDSAFQNCTNLTSVSFGNRAAQIGSGAFYMCFNLTTVYFKGDAPSLGTIAFLNVTNATFYYLPGKAGWSSPFGGRPAVLWKPRVQTNDGHFGAGTNGFGFTMAWSSEMIVLVEACTNLAKPIWFPLQTNILDSDTAYFSDPQWTDYPGRFYRLSWLSSAQIQDYNFTINGGGIIITKYTGSNSAVTIPNTIIGLPVTGIGDEAFRSCTYLTNIIIPDSVTSIGDEAFRYCPGLTNFTISKHITSIGNNVFSFSTNLTAITVDLLNPVYCSVDGVLFNKSQTTLIQCPGGRPGSYTIPNGVTSIGARAFWSCTSLTNITVPSGVTSVGQAAFRYCSGLTEVTVSQSVAYFGNLAFSDCTNLKQVFYYGDAPGLGGSSVFQGVNATVFYLPGTTGWGTTFGGLPTVLWKPRAILKEGGSGAGTNEFGFNIVWAGGMSVAVDACTNLPNPVWTPLQTNILSGNTLYFSDPEWTNYPARFYRLRWP